MRLTLRPSSSYLIPPTLQSHLVPLPTLPPPSKLKTPNAFLKARRRLSELGLVLPHVLAADRSLWWQFAIREVEWDLEDEQVVVSFRDGSEERWDLGENDIKSCELIEDSSEEVGGKIESGGGNVKDGRRSPWTPSLVLAQLRQLCVELRSAYEDVGTAQDPLAPDFSGESDYLELMKLSADPKRCIPIEWSDAQKLYEYVHDVNGELSGENEEEGPPTRPSQSEAKGDDEEDPFRFTGQFVSRRRPRQLDSSLRVEGGIATRIRHDYLSLIHLLNQVRQYLADLFSLTVIPKLRHILPPTYSLWAVDGAIVWTRRQAVESSADVAQLILDLLDDDGDELSDFGSDDQLEPDIAVFDGIANYEPDDLLQARFSLNWHDQEKRRQDNPLFALKDDYQLRCWCESALYRRRETKNKEWAASPGKPAWSRPIEPWSVALSVEGGSDLDEPRSGNGGMGGRKRGGFRGIGGLPASLQPKTLTTPPTSPPGGDLDTAYDEDDEFPGEIAVPELEASTSSGEETDEEEYDASLSRVRSRSTAFFYPEDLVDEHFLPVRLPKEVVMSRKDRGREMEKRRAELHEKLDEVAGLQKKLHDLQHFVTEEAGNWEDARESERKEKSPSPSIASGLSRLGASSRSPPPGDVPTKDVPIKAQPLRLQAADRSLTSMLTLALNQLEPSPKVRQQHLRHFASPKRPKSPNPRKRQRLNLETHDKVVALAMRAELQEAGSEAEGSGSGPRKGKEKTKKRKRSVGTPAPSSSVRKDAAEVADEEAPPKKRRRKDFRPVKREGAVIISDPNVPFSSARMPSSRSGPSSTIAAISGPSSAVVPDSRHLTALELSNRRRAALESAQPPPSLQWLESMELDDMAKDELSTYVPREGSAGDDVFLEDAEAEKDEGAEMMVNTHQRDEGFAEDDDEEDV
ncbi:hypothetical protein JCM11251_002987 [Rhodosporidiobolus azoricus]